jgi:hypothetical protein
MEVVTEFFALAFSIVPFVFVGILLCGAGVCLLVAGIDVAYNHIDPGLKSVAYDLFASVILCGSGVICFIVGYTLFGTVMEAF